MYLKNMSLHHFRNYEAIDVTFKNGINILLGENAQGKTNLLEAIYFLALTRSHRTNSDRELISWDAEAAQVVGRVQKQTTSVPLEIDLGKSGKRAKINHLEQANYHSILVTKRHPVRTRIIIRGATGSASFIDMEFGQMNSRYLYNLSQYRTILKQRNRYLKELAA